MYPNLIKVREEFETTVSELIKVREEFETTVSELNKSKRRI